MTKNLCPKTLLVCEKDCILYQAKGKYQDEKKQLVPAHCGAYGTSFPIEEVT